MAFRRLLLAEYHVTFRARKVRILLLRVNFEIQDAAVTGGRGHVATITSAARLHRHFHRLEINRAKCRGINFVTVQAIQIRMLAAFVAEPTSRHPATPTREHGRVRAHARS